jgi:protease II
MKHCVLFIFFTYIQTKMDSYNWLRDETRKDEVSHVILFHESNNSCYLLRIFTILKFFII